MNYHFYKLFPKIEHPLMFLELLRNKLNTNWKLSLELLCLLKLVQQQLRQAPSPYQISPMPPTVVLMEQKHSMEKSSMFQASFCSQVLSTLTRILILKRQELLRLTTSIREAELRF